jgi:hypothetical protein
MVDLHSDSRLADYERFDPTASRRIEMRVEAVFAETQRNDIRRRTDDHVRSKMVMIGKAWTVRQKLETVDAPSSSARLSGFSLEAYNATQRLLSLT